MAKFAADRSIWRKVSAGGKWRGRKHILLRCTIFSPGALYWTPNTPIEILFQDTAMTLNTEQFTAANKATVDSLLAVANTALASAERIAALNLDTARSALEDTVTGVQSVIGAKDPQAALAAQSSLAQPAVDKAVAYGRSVYEITTQTQQELTKMVEAQIGNFQKSVAGMVEMAAKSAPVGSEGAVAAMQSAIAAANSAFGNMNSVAKQFADAAQANIAALTKQGR
jgi:phasin family protein